MEQSEAWSSRGYLPHFDIPYIYQFITFHLADSLPLEVINRLKYDSWCKNDSEKRKYLESSLDKAYGSCYLLNPTIAEVVENALLYFHEKRYRIFAWVIMPNHVHVLIEVFDSFPLSKIVRSWKWYSARQANIILNREGSFWYREYHDRFIRNEEHFNSAINYIHNNPVKAGLAKKAEDWQFSSTIKFHKVNSGSD